MRDVREELAVLKTPIPQQFQWISYENKDYRLAHIDDHPKQLLHIALAQTHPNNKLTPNLKKLELLEEIITDLIAFSSFNLLEDIEDQNLPYDFKLKILKKARQKGETLTYYRWVLRTLITDFKYAREFLNLDRDEELEAVHHLDKARHTNPQINFELGLWKALEENYAEAAYHFTELYKILPADYTPTGNPEKLTTLTIEKLRGYLGIYSEVIQPDEDESYARELFHYSKQLDGKTRTTREFGRENLVNEQQALLNLDLINSKIANSDVNSLLKKGKKFLKAAVLEGLKYEKLSRSMFEMILSKFTEEQVEIWPQTIYCCAALTPLEGRNYAETLNNQFFRTYKEIISKFGCPSMNQWIYLIGLTIDDPSQGEFFNSVRALPNSGELIPMIELVERIKVLCVKDVVMTDDFYDEVYRPTMEQLEKTNSKHLEKLISSIRNYNIAYLLAKWFFTTVRVLKFTHKLKHTEADSLFSFIDLISFESPFMYDIPTDIDYKIKTNIKDFSLMHFLTKASLTQCKKLDPNLNIEYFFGNLAFLLEKFYLALTHYLKAASLIKSEKFYKRLCYSLMKSDAMFEGIILLQLLDRSYNFETVKQIIPKIYMNPILFGFIFDINLLELLIELNSHNNLTKSSLVTYIQYSLIDSPTRHQSLSSSNLPTQLLDQFLDLLHFTMTYLKS